MPSSASAAVTLPTDEQILIVREFDAPRELVYRAWTTPELVMRWWSGRRGTMKVAEIDLRAGGAWRYVMEAHGGFEVGFHGAFREIVPNERLVYTEIYEGMPDGDSPPGMPDGDSPPALNTATFTERGGRTTLELLTEVESRAIRDTIIQSGMEGGVQEQMELLEELAISLR